MNDLDLLDRYGPDAADVSDAALASARARLLAGMDPAAVPGRPSFPARRLAIAGLALAGAVAVAVVAIPRPAARPDAAPTTTPTTTTTAPASPGTGTGTGTGTDAIRLVAATAPAFPYTISGLGDAVFTADPGGPVIAVYLAEDRSDVYLNSTTEDDGGALSGAGVIDVEIDGRPGRIVAFNGTAADGRPPLTLVWEHRDGVWLRLTGQGRYGTPGALIDLAGKVRDRPQRLHFEVTVGLVPDGWELAAFKDESILMYRDPVRPETDFHVQWAPRSKPLFRAAEIDGLEKATKVTVRGRPADLFRARDFWMVQTRLADRSIVRVMTPRTFTTEQVLQLTASVRRSR
jgi:hypothetical protein